MPTAIPAPTPLDVLRRHWGHSAFRPGQEDIIACALRGEDALALLPTGGGKSICYQVPALCMNRLCLVVTPLIALMRDQVEGLRARAITAAAITAGMKRAEVENALEAAALGRLSFLYVSPERLGTELFQARLPRMPVGLIAVDEAHCISQWGYDFRPAYLRIAELRQRLPGVPLLALTASATPEVAQDIMRRLAFRAPRILRGSFAWPGLALWVSRGEDREGRMLRILRHVPGSAIVYLRERRGTQRVAQLLARHGISAAAYHAGLPGEERERIQRAWTEGRTRVVAATIAFGMGIDKPDVRFVIHHDIPKSLESYYQETGRAGRDGGEGKCVAFYSYKDIEKLEKFLQGKPVAEQEIGRQLLADTVSFAETSMCRRRFLLHYFGEHYPEENCRSCDNCLSPREHFEAKDDLALVLRAVKESKERHRAKFLCDLLTGTETSEIKNYKGDKLQVYGEGDDKDSHHWMAIVRQAVVGGFLHKDIETYGNLSLTAAGKKFLAKPVSIKFVKERDYSDYEGGDEDEPIVRAGAAADERLMAMLKDLRKKEAHRLKLQPWVLFQDPSLEEMTMRYPVTIEELTQVSGVGPGKAQKFGRPFVELIAKYVEENDIERPEEVTVRNVVNKSSNKVHIIQNIDKRIPLDAIARSKNLSMPDFLSELESIVMSGTRLDISYHLNDMLEADAQQEIMDYFRSAESDDLEAAFQEFDGDFSEEELRMMRLKFMSEVAN
ncbi:MAG: RecQ family ATP-dependent DNA helicase [Flavobacteriales bacterium]